MIIKKFQQMNDLGYSDNWKNSIYFFNAVNSLYKRYLNKINTISIKLENFGFPNALQILPDSLPSDEPSGVEFASEKLSSYAIIIKEMFEDTYEKRNIGRGRFTWKKVINSSQSKYFFPDILMEKEVQKIYKYINRIEYIAEELTDKFSDEEIIEKLETIIPIEKWPSKEQGKEYFDNMDIVESAWTPEKGKRPNPKGLGRLMVKKRKLEERESPQNVAVAPGDLYKNIFDLTPEEKEKEMKNWNEWGERNRKRVDEHSTENEKRRLLDKMLNLKEDEPKLTLDDLLRSKKKEQETNI